MKSQATKQPTAIILADQLLDDGLKTAFGKHEKALLAVSGSTVIEYILLELQYLNFSQCFVLAGKNADEINVIAMGLQHLKINIEVMNYAPSKDEVLRDFNSMSQPNGLLLIEANQLRSQSIQQFLDLSNRTDYLLYSAIGSKKPLGLTYLKPSNADFIINAKPIEMNDVVADSRLTTKVFY